jgi:sulfur-oxidizing protein SoxY
MNITRRDALRTTGALGTLVSLGLVTAEQAAAAESRAEFASKTLSGALEAIGGQPANSDQIEVIAPDIAENGAVVPVATVSKLPNTTDVWFLVENNPQPLAAQFSFPAGTAPEVKTRVKMGKTSDIIVVAKADGKLYMAKKETKVTLGGCGG